MPGVPLARRAVAVEVSDNTATEPPTLGGFGDRRFERAERFWRVSGTEENVAPRDDLLIALPKLPDTIVSAERTPDGDVWFCASLAVDPPDPRQAGVLSPLRAFTVFWDASASRAGDHAKEIAGIRGAFAEKKGSFRLVVFRNAVEPAQTFETVDALADALEKVDYDGGTDFAAVAAAIAATEGPAFLFTDGMDTLSGKPIDFAGRKDVFAFVSGAEIDRESLRQACGGRVFGPDLAEAKLGTWPDGSLHGFNDEQLVSGVTGTGIADVQGVGRPCIGRATILGRLVADQSEIVLDCGAARLRGLDAPTPAVKVVLRASAAKPGSTLATAWAAMRVQQLSPRADDNADELLAIGRRFGVASPATSLLVLESLDQWLRHDIEPPESLPQMREQWFAAKKNRPAEDPEAKAARHLEMLKNQWKQRMEWWSTDFSKVKPPEPAGKRRAIPQDGMAAPEESNAEAEDDDVLLDAAPARMMGRAVASGGIAARAAAPAAPAAAREAGSVRGASAPRAGSISVKAWSPDTPYLKALDAAEDSHAAYLAQRADWAASPAFYLDCAGWFFAHGDHEFGVRVLSNLAELRIEDPALLRVMAWRLKQAAGEFIAKMRLCGTWFGFLPGSSAQTYEQAIAILRRVCKLRPEDAQSWRDLALALDEYGREALPAYAKPEEAVDNLAEALDLYRKVALTPWARHPDSISLFAVEEYNALYAWCTNRPSYVEADEGVELPPFVHRLSAFEPLPEGLRGVPDCDMRVVMSWDADETDVDLHVTEPSGEEAYYGHRRTRSGGDVSKDITDGYGPEEYLIRKAPAGGYRIRAHYYASHQQEVFGPATATATIFTDWGRPNQLFQTLSIRLDKAREMIELGTVQIGGKEGVTAVPAAAAPALRKDMAVDEVKALFGDPAATEGDTLAWNRPGGRTLKATFADGKLVRAVEILPGGAETILVQ
jgi:tetratricopeptide (TPR) repeat protein